MRSRKLVLIVGSVAAVVIAGLATGFIRAPFGNRDSRPPCDQLPTRDAADLALHTHAGITERIVKIGNTVSVAVALPCGSQDRAILLIRYASDAQREAIQAVLQDGGFGVPVELVSGT